MKTQPLPPLWFQTGRAPALLASCAANPPVRANIRQREGEIAPPYTRADARVAELRRLYRDAEPAIDTPEWREWIRLTPDTVIERAIARGAERRAA